jgi:branched-chain amino acid transport system substrate-binding protein
MRSRRRQIVFALLALALLALALPACKRNRPGITIGLYASMTGAEAEFGLSTRRGVQLAIDEINQRGGVHGQRVWLASEDTRGDSTEAASAVTRLIGREGAVGIIGEIASSLSLAGGRVAQRHRIPMITPSSTNATVTQLGDHVFRVCFIDPFQGTVMARFARDLRVEGRPVQRVAIFRDQGSAYSIGLAQSFRETFTRLGGQIVDEQSYRASDSHFSAQLGAMLAQRPDAIFLPGYYTQAALIAREARGLGFRGPFLGGDGWDAPALYENDADALVGSYFSEGFAPDHPTTARGQHFVEAYRARYGAPANGLAALGYDAALLMLDAMQRAGGGDPARVRDAIAQTRDFEGATGHITIDAERNAIKSAVVLAVEPNAFRFERAIEPSELQ